MSGTFQFELVSPEKLLVSKDVVMVTVPGGEGDYSVLVGHAPMITTLRPGVIEIYGQDDVTVTERIFVASGFAEVTATRCTVLAEGAVPVADIDRVKVEEHIKRLSENMPHSNGKTAPDTVAIERQISVARAQLQAIAA